MELLSIIVPCYNEQETLEDFYQAICPIRDELLEKYCLVEVILVDDGSKDNTLAIMKEISRENPWIGYMALTRNFGKEAAMYAGLQRASGDYVCIMDVDLQDPPEMIPQMLEIIREGIYDCVGCRRVSRKGEPILRSLCARLFYKLMRRISDVEIVDGARDFRLMTRRYVNSLLELTEYNRFSKGLFGWVGYETKWLEYENVERKKGETKWSFMGLVKYSIDAIVDFSTLPVRFSAWVGLVFCMLAFVFIVVIIVRTLLFGDPVAGWPSLVCIILLLSGIQLFCLGLLGEYMSKIYLETKKRPIYLCKETNVDELNPDWMEAVAAEAQSVKDDKKSRGKKKKDKKSQGKRRKAKSISVVWPEEDSVEAPLTEEDRRRSSLAKYGWKDDESDSSVFDEDWDEDEETEGLTLEESVEADDEDAELDACNERIQRQIERNAGWKEKLWKTLEADEFSEDEDEDSDDEDSEEPDAETEEFEKLRKMYSV